MPSKSGSIVSCGPGSVIFSPLTRRDSKSGVGVLADVIAGGDTAALGSAARMAEQPNDAITKATATVRASNATVTLPSGVEKTLPPHVSPYDLHKDYPIISQACERGVTVAYREMDPCRWAKSDRHPWKGLALPAGERMSVISTCGSKRRKGRQLRPKKSPSSGLGAWAGLPNSGWKATLRSTYHPDLNGF